MWRKKWEKDWEQVIYCSERCRRGKGQADRAEIMTKEDRHISY